MTDRSTIITDIFAVAPSRYVRTVAMAHAGSVLAIALYVGVGASLFILPVFWGVKGLLLWFVLVMLLLPMVLALAWFHTALSPGAALQILPHRIEIDGTQTTVSLVFEPKDENSLPRPSITVRREDIESVRIIGGDMLLKLRNSEVKYILLPPEEASKLKILFTDLLPPDSFEA